MKAMEILFDRIDELNAEIKSESDMCRKFIKALEVEQIIKAMKELENLRVGHILNIPVSIIFPVAVTTSIFSYAQSGSSRPQHPLKDVSHHQKDRLDVRV